MCFRDLPYNIAPIENNTVLCTSNVKGVDLLLSVFTTIKQMQNHIKILLHPPG